MVNAFFPLIRAVILGFVGAAAVFGLSKGITRELFRFSSLWGRRSSRP